MYSLGLGLSMYKQTPFGGGGVVNSFYLNGTGCINSDSDLVHLADDTTGYLSLDVKIFNWANSNQGMFLGFGDTDGASFLYLWISANKIQAALKIGAVVQWNVVTDVAIHTTYSLKDGDWFNVKITHNGTQPVLAINQTEPAQSFGNNTDTTKWFNDVPLLDNGRIGCISFNSGGNTNIINAEFDNVDFNGVSKYTFSDSRDNYNDDTANEWEFYNALSSNTMTTSGADESDVRPKTPTYTLIIDGDSIDDGNGTSESWIFEVQDGLTMYPRYLINNVAVGGQNIDGSTPSMVDDTTAPNWYNAARDKNIILMGGGTNDVCSMLLLGRSVANIMTDWTTYVVARQAEGFVVIPRTVLPRSAPACNNLTNFETDRQALNALIVSYCSANGMQINDIGANATIGQLGDSDNLTYYKADKTHLTQAGADILGDGYIQPIKNILG